MKLGIALLAVTVAALVGREQLSAQNVLIELESFSSQPASNLTVSVHGSCQLRSTTDPRLALKLPRSDFQSRQFPTRYPPAPGVYEASPFTGIIVVPGPHPDDRCIIKPGHSPTMPQLAPDLRLIPRGKAPPN